MDSHQLSNRLQIVSEYVPTNARLADIGSDHAYLPAHLLLSGQIDFAVAGDIANGPYQNILEEIERSNLSDRLIARLAPGLAAIKEEDQINTVTITGMGGLLMTQILDEGNHLSSVQRLILQPNRDESVVRSWLGQHGWQIIDENIVLENGHFYEIIVAQRTNEVHNLTDSELKFGRYLKSNHFELFFAKWQKEVKRMQQVLSQLEANSQIDLANDMRRQLNQIREEIAK